MPHGHKMPARPPAPGPILVDVLAGDIADAVRADSGACVIADALNRAIPGARAEVDLQSITLTLRDKGYRYTWFTPDDAQTLLLQFDQGETVGPITVELRGRILAKARRLRTPAEKAARPNHGGTIAGQYPGGGTAADKVANVEGTGRPVDIRRKAPPAAVLSTRKGRRRIYGLRQAKPGVAGGAA